MYYSSFGILSLIIHSIINYDTLKRNDKTNHNAVKEPYRWFLISVMIYYVTDIIWGFLYERKISTLVYIDTVLYFVLMVITVLLWTKFVVAYFNRQSVFEKILEYCGVIIVVFEIITLIINFFVPIVFYIDENGIYQPKQARYITLGIQVLLFLGTAIYALIVSRIVEGKERLYHRMIGYDGIIMTIFIVLQTLNPLLPFYAIGCLLVTCLIHSFISLDVKTDYHQRLDIAHMMAYKDFLTKVKNHHAYLEAKEEMDQRIADGEIREFGVVVFDVNGLKEINDTLGHTEGDRYIKEASHIICKQFKHSPVYRIGGDEFVAILEGDDYQNRDSLIHSFEKTIHLNKAKNAVVVSYGMDIFLPETDNSYESVFERADKKMYVRKKELKS